MVNGQMNWHIEKRDTLYEQFSIFVGHELMATGNMKKNTSFEKLVKQIYTPISDRKSNKELKNGLKWVGEAVINKKRAELKQRFSIE